MSARRDLDKRTPSFDLEPASIYLERVTGYDSIRTVRSHYTAYNNGEEVKGTYQCVMPGCSFRRRDAQAMWLHVHFGPHKLSFDMTKEQLVELVLSDGIEAWGAPEPPEAA